ncbi:hypothetical protein [Methanopyrus sp.]
MIKGVDGGSRLRGELVVELPAEVASGVLWEGGPKGFRHEIDTQGNRVRVTFEARSSVKALSGIDALLACIRVSEEVLKLVRSVKDWGDADG